MKHPGVQYEPGDSLAFGTYHSLEVICSWLSRWEKEYPGLVELYEVDRSFEGQAHNADDNYKQGKGKGYRQACSFL